MTETTDLTTDAVGSLPTECELTAKPRQGPDPSHRTRDCAPYFHVLAKPTGAIGNLDRKYCFLLSKEALYPGD